MKIVKIISGGQTGADRGGLDAAIKMRIPHGGFCPKQRRAEDGTIPKIYNLIETTTTNYLARTEKNVIESDATIIFTKKYINGGSKKTIDFAQKHNKPYIYIDVDISIDEAVNKIDTWLHKLGRNITLNIAGSRESKCPNIREYTRQTLEIICSNHNLPCEKTSRSN